MAKELIQFVIDADTKAKALAVCKEKGFSLSAFLQLSVLRLVVDNDPNFDAEAYEEEAEKRRKVLDLLHQDAVAAGITDMTLEEINEEIAAARREMDERNS